MENPLNQSFISHKDIMNGGTLHFEMNNSATQWATKDNEVPETKIEDHIIITPPFISKGDTAFKGNTEVELQSNTKEASIYYSENDSDYKKYDKPFAISEAKTLKVYSELNGKKSKTITTNFFKIDPNLSIKLDSEYANQYNAGGNDALIDGIIGAQDFRTGTWQGYFDTDVVATVDLGSVKNFIEISTSFLQDQRAWIFYPTEVECFVSKNGKTFKSLGIQKINSTIQSDDVEIKTISFSPPKTNYRYVKIVAKKLGKLPTWHLGYEHDGRSWLFVDEISIK